MFHYLCNVVCTNNNQYNPQNHKQFSITLPLQSLVRKGSLYFQRLLFVPSFHDPPALLTREFFLKRVKIQPLPNPPVLVALLCVQRWEWRMTLFILFRVFLCPKCCPDVLLRGVFVSGCFAVSSGYPWKVFRQRVLLQCPNIVDNHGNSFAFSSV